MPDKPGSLTECNCSICRRLSGLWAYYRRDEVRVACAPGALSAYVWGDRCIEFYHCTTCGCTTHYESVEKLPDSRVAVNVRGAEPADIEGIPIRRFDGAATWKYIDG